MATDQGLSVWAFRDQTRLAPAVNWSLPGSPRPTVLWSGQCEVSLKTGDTKTVTLQTGAKLAAGQSVSIVLIGLTASCAVLSLLDGSGGHSPGSVAGPLLSDCDGQ